MVTGDGAYIKQLNRSVIIKNVIEHGYISRAQISKITGLNKATVSVQVADLLDEELIVETQVEHTGIGRKPIMLSINSAAGYVLGIDLDRHLIQYTLSNLQGVPVESFDYYPETSDYKKMMELLTTQIQEFEKKCEKSRYGLVNILIGIHGTVNKDESILFVPALEWHNYDLKKDLSDYISTPVHIENNANLASYAERVYKHHHSGNLLNINLTSGIGAGIMIDGKLHRGYHGYAGEMGHMIISPGGIPCQCGNKGCWEKYSSERSLFSKLKEELGLSTIDHTTLKALIDQKDTKTMEILDSYIQYLSIGLNNIINLYNPETLVLNSQVLRIHPDAVNAIKSNLHSSVSNYREIVLSELGEKACVLGASALAVQRFLKVNEMSITMPDTAEIDMMEVN